MKLGLNCWIEGTIVCIGCLVTLLAVGLYTMNEAILKIVPVMAAGICIISIDYIAYKMHLLER